MQIYWYGYGGSSNLAEELRPIINELGCSLTTIHEWENADVKWNRITWLSELKKADIIIIPCNYKIQNCKSNNRLTQAFSLGKPVICSPLPAYLDILKEIPKNSTPPALIATTKEEWKKAIEFLKDRPDVRQQMSMTALQVAQSYSLEAITKKWISVLTEDLSISKDKDIVDIVIPTYKNLRGLKQCIESIRNCTNIPYKIIIVNNGNSEELNNYLKAQQNITYIKRDRLNFAQAINIGITSGTGKYVLILNDDVIVSKNWLKILVDTCKENVGAVGPLSNCDKNWLHMYDITIEGVNLLPGTNTFTEIEPIISQIYEYKSSYNKIIEREWIAAYCTLIQREVLEKTGLLNEEFVNSGEDVDLCYRIKKMGYKIVQNFNSFVFHYGAISRKQLESENKEAYQEADKKTNEHLKHLWNKKSIVIYSGPSWEKWDFRTMDTTGLGGSECWQIYLSREFQKLGYRVICFADTPQEEIKDGEIVWLNYINFNKYIEQHYIDYFISSRTTDPFKLNIRSSKNFVQIHDIWMLSAKEQLFLDKVNKFCALSDWHLNFAADYHKIPKEKMALTANGIDLSRYDNIQVKKNSYRLHWSSSWDRGLDNVLYLWPFLKQELPELELHCFYGLYNWEQSCISRNDKEGLKKIEELKKAVQQPGIFTYGRINQKELAIEQSKASLLLYPSWFSETFWITGIECQYANVPIICNKYAGIITTLQESAILLGNGEAYWPYTQEGRIAFYNETISILKDKNKWNFWAEKGKTNAKRYSWQNCALNWEKLFKE
jgi:GT2 family glycosyltransferase